MGVLLSSLSPTLELPLQSPGIGNNLSKVTKGADSVLMATVATVLLLTPRPQSSVLRRGGPCHQHRPVPPWPLPKMSLSVMPSLHWALLLSFCLPFPCPLLFSAVLFFLLLFSHLTWWEPDLLHKPQPSLSLPLLFWAVFQLLPLCALMAVSFSAC